MKKINVNINGIDVVVPEGTTILNAAKKVHIDIPTLCYHPDQKIKGSCRVCIVEVEGQSTFSAACCTPVRNGMRIKTNTKKVREARKTILELILADHNCDCLTCIRNGNCELQILCEEHNIDTISFDKVVKLLPINDKNPAIVRDESKCIKCGRCVEVCNEVQGIGAIYNINRSCEMKIGTAYDKELKNVKCTYCGQCINVCPVGAIYEKSNIDEVWQALEDDNKHVVVQMAPAVRVSLGEKFGMQPGSIVTGKIVSFLRKIGFDKVFDTNFTADLTIIEEGNELLHRINNNGKLPMITSCSPGWIRFIEYFYPELLDHLSTCKSPQQMFGALAKTYYAEKFNINPENIVVVSIMPCTAKKAEALREEMSDSGYQDIDVVLTTRELARLIKQSRIRIEELKEEDFDSPFGITTGAAAIFGATGGVMEAALRTVYEEVTGEELKNIDFKNLRGINGFKEGTVKVGEIDVKVAVVNGLKNARMILEMIKQGKADYHFIEVMCCPGGCIGGGGQPRGTNDIKKKRIEAIYKVDIQSAIRKSHDNPVIKTLYKEFLTKPLGYKSHKLLHTHYKDRSDI
ncbi:NADH-dependent [FeFe] hydrogenase, group A6 [Paramaledivibacter caminithermalis]|jgi:iron-only hydrogenase group A|uniref:NAD(P)-dependent iron-only hydrogenase catalytic subunit n=1 Tax=Paramaledivibacter caminithermalis (strain DSM 15212 / CIP 107654 / DViRD3) TaxID=1121301 RepID=A0A1M6PUG1_PARC5|nr:NADH-dependent [FeFe] hydrogenase, group A6 [Paramaledivibacter caminithermalis]SHK11547.1 NAD(P)-dependent iron-only hydrogenase catalytic subunit [Paramaledivibacter caminithermalis DSM 15212]